MAVRPTQHGQYTLAIYEAVMNLFDEDNEDKLFSLDDIDGTAFFTAFVAAFTLVFNQLTNADIDMIEAISTANWLTVQHLLSRAGSTPYLGHLAPSVRVLPTNVIEDSPSVRATKDREFIPFEGDGEA